MDGQVSANLLHQTNLLQIRDENGDPAERGHRSLGLTQNHPLAREQSSDSLRNGLSEVFASTPRLSQGFTRQVQLNFGFQEQRSGIPGQTSRLPIDSANSVIRVPTGTSHRPAHSVNRLWE
jgi:hypothetical protein